MGSEGWAACSSGCVCSVSSRTVSPLLLIIELSSQPVALKLVHYTGQENANTLMGYIGIIGYILGLYRDDGKENENYYGILGLHKVMQDFLHPPEDQLRKWLEPAAGDLVRWTALLGFEACFGLGLGGCR